MSLIKPSHLDEWLASNEGRLKHAPYNRYCCSLNLFLDVKQLTLLRADGQGFVIYGTPKISSTIALTRLTNGSNSKASLPFSAARFFAVVRAKQADNHGLCFHLVPVPCLNRQKWLNQPFARFCQLRIHEQ